MTRARKVVRLRPKKSSSAAQRARMLATCRANVAKWRALHSDAVERESVCAAAHAVSPGNVEAGALHAARNAVRRAACVLAFCEGTLAGAVRLFETPAVVLKGPWPASK